MKKLPSMGLREEEKEREGEKNCVFNKSLFENTCLLPKFICIAKVERESN
jgi:hypothetical protein